MPAAKPRPGTLAPHETLDLCALLGSEWDGFCLTSDGLVHPYWRRAFKAGEFRALFWRCQRVRILEHDLASLRAQLEASQAAQEAAEARAQWFRRQLIHESRYGLMFDNPQA